MNNVMKPEWILVNESTYNFVDAISGIVIATLKDSVKEEQRYSKYFQVHIPVYIACIEWSFTYGIVTVIGRVVSYDYAVKHVERLAIKHCNLDITYLPEQIEKESENKFNTLPPASLLYK